MMPRILVTGGTGTLGSAIVARLSENENNQIWIYSRDENKQKALIKIHPDVIPFVGDICNANDLWEMTYKKFEFDHIYHCAAMKHIEVCERHVHKCVDTNYGGVKNVYDVLGRNAKRFTLFTTDKAVAPINAYGYAKALAEKYLSQFDNVQVFRWGNVIGSTGSVLPLLCRCAVKGEVFTMTDPYMTRFWININDAVKFVLNNKDYVGSAIYPPMISASLSTLVFAVEKIIGNKIKTNKIDVRPGEKQHECMIADYESPRFYSSDKQVFVKDLVETIKPWVNQWVKKNT